MNVSSFLVDHDILERGVYVSRVDSLREEFLTTFDIRIKKPNKEPVLGNSEIHTMEHLMATYMRSDKSMWFDKVIYIGPMGCRTGMYLILKGRFQTQDIIKLLKDTFLFIINFEGKIPASTSKECGDRKSVV